MINKIILALFILLGANPLLAEEIKCTTSIRGNTTKLYFDDEENALYDNYSFREIFFGGWGETTCPAFITMRYLTPDLTDSQRSAFCLNYDKTNKTFTGYSLGIRNAYLECKEPKKSLCQRVNDSKGAAIAISSGAAGLTGGASAAASAAGVTAVAHSSGAVILTGASGYIAGTLATLGATALAVLTAPATITAAAVSVVAVGGAVYICKDEGQEAKSTEDSAQDK